MREGIYYESLEKDISSTSVVTCRVRSRKTGTAVPFAQLWNTSKGSSKQREWPCRDRAVANHLHRRSKQWSRGHKTSPTALTRVTSTGKISCCFAIAQNSSSIHSCESAIVWWESTEFLLHFTRRYATKYYLIIPYRKSNRAEKSSTTDKIWNMTFKPMSYQKRN